MALYRPSANEIAAARAVPIEAIVGAVVSLNRAGFGLCPFHAEQTPSFHIHRQRNRWKCFGCGAGGDGIAFVQRFRGLDFGAAIADLTGATRGFSRRSPRLASAVETVDVTSPSSTVSTASIDHYIAELWAGADAPRLAELYLYSRHIRPNPLPAALRGHNRVWCAETRQHRPAVLAAVTAEDDRVIAVQRIWVAPVLLTDSGTSPQKGTRASDLTAPKKTLGTLGAAAVRLGAATQVIGLAEGIETALSVTRHWRVPVWATLGAQRLSVIRLPKQVQRVIIFGDNGAAGEKAGAAAVSAYRRRGYMAQSVFPEPSYKDFNAQLAR